MRQFLHAVPHFVLQKRAEFLDKLVLVFLGKPGDIHFVAQCDSIVPAILDQVFIIRVDEYAHIFSHEPLSAIAKDNGFGDELTFVYLSLHSVRINVLASTIHNHIFGPAGDEDIAVLIDFSQVAGIKPPIPEYLFGLLNVIIVTLHHIVALDNDLADTVRAGIVDFYLYTLDRNANRADSDFTDGISRNYRRGFSQPIPFEKFDAQLDKSLDY